MKKLFLLTLVTIGLNPIYGQNKEVAVLQPRIIGGGTVSTNDQLIISSSMKKAFTQLDGYEAFSRTSQSLIAAEQAFQSSGQVDDRQIKEVGKQTGVAYICVFTLSKEKNELVVNSDIINVVTGKIENSDFIVLLDVTDRNKVMQQCQELAYNLLGVSYTGNKSYSSNMYLIEKLKSCGFRFSDVVREMCTINGQNGDCKVESFIGVEKSVDNYAYTSLKINKSRYWGGECKNGFLNGLVLIDVNGTKKESRENMLAYFVNGRVAYPILTIYTDENYFLIGVEEGKSSYGCVYVGNWNSEDRGMCKELKKIYGNQIFTTDFIKNFKNGTIDLNLLKKNFEDFVNSGKSIYWRD
jgi:hypothetical protein